MEEHKLATNLDTNFLKLLAVISMTLDHVGAYLLPEVWVLRLVGRVAFPLFAYCAVVGCLYTQNMRRYVLRLGLFAVVSQPIYALPGCTSLAEYMERLPVPNIFFTLLVGVAAVWGLKERKWWLTAVAVLCSAFVNLDYGFYGVVLMVLFYFFRARRWLSLLVVAAYLSMDFMQLYRWPYIAALQGFAVLSLPLIYGKTAVHPRIGKYFFYIYYPAHLLVIFFVQRLLG